MSVFSLKKKCQKSVLNMASSDSQIDKPQCGCPRRAELPDANINTGMQSIHTKSFLFSALSSNSDKRQLIFIFLFYFISFAIKTQHTAIIQQS